MTDRENALKEALSRAIDQHKMVEIFHTKSTGEESKRFVLPFYLVSDNHGHTYVHGYCTLRRDKRSFRVDRINDLHIGTTVQADSVYINHLVRGLHIRPLGEVLAEVHLGKQ